jgi:16S rRNA (cytosine1402-N4)-methyltransferase
MVQTPPSFVHQSVLLDAVITALAPRDGGRYLDGTLGGAGHAAAVLQAAPGARLVGIDRDPQALAAAAQRLAPFGDRARLCRGPFSAMAELAANDAPFDGILLDLGVSSPQLDQADRGFSFQQDGPPDMRMDPDQARDLGALLDEVDADALADILFQYGEEPRSRPIARAILAGRPWTSTRALADAIAKASGWKNSKVHPATRSFQALRIAVNDELGELERVLPVALSLLAPGGRLAIISFHSLEDRIVKHFFRAESGQDGPRDGFGNPLTPPRLRLLHRRPLDGAELDPSNPRARSARLRVAERLA